MADASLPGWIGLKRKARCIAAEGSLAPIQETYRWKHSAPVEAEEHGPRTLAALRRTQAWDRIVRFCLLCPDETSPRDLWMALSDSENIRLFQQFHGLDGNSKCLYRPGVLCSSNSIGTPAASILETVTILSTSPEQALDSQCHRGPTGLRDSSLRHGPCPPETGETLLRSDQTLNFGKDRIDNAVGQKDMDGYLPIDYFLHQLQSGWSPFGLRQLQLVAQDNRAQLASCTLIRLLSLGSSSRCGFQLHGKKEAHFHLDGLNKAVKLLLESQQLRDSSLCTARMTGCNPLHLAIRNYGFYSPLLVTLLDHCKGRPTGDSIFLARNVCGELSLHVACRAGVPLPVLQVILKRTLGAIKRINGAQSRRDTVILSVDKDGFSPLELTWICHVESTVHPIFVTLRTVPETSTARRHVLYTGLIDKMVNQVIDRYEGSELERQHYAQRVFGDLQTRTFLLIRAASGMQHSKESSHMDEFILHNAANLSGPTASSLPLPLLTLILWQYRCQASRTDCFGKLPLHYALDFSLSGSSATPEKAENWTRWIKQLCSGYAGACVVADSDGRLPLHYALLSGYHEVAPCRDGLYPSSHTCRDKVDRCCDEVVLHVFFSCTQSAESRDPLSGLFPFMLAASNPCLSLSTVYDLLRHFPVACAKQ
jgi:hypothetical protein